MTLKTAPECVRDIVDGIAAKRGVTLYRKESGK